MDLVDTIGRETGHATRTLLRAPSFSLIGAFTLALGLGAATSIFTLLDRVVLRALPYPHSERMIHIGSRWPKVLADQEYWISKGQYFHFRRNSRSLAGLALYDADMLAIPGDATQPAERVPALAVSASLFGLLGIRPEGGHLFAADEELAPDPRVALITHDFWRRRFGGDPRIIGRRLQLVGLRVEIIGILPQDASVPNTKADIWMPIRLDPNEPPVKDHTHHAIGLLEPGVGVATAAAEIARLQSQFADAHPNLYGRDFLNRTGFAIHVTSLRDFVVGGTIGRGLWLLFGAVGFVLLIAAANVANLFLVRIDARRREVAVRTALGARRAHLAVHYLAESLLLSIVAWLGAVALAYGLLHVVLTIAPQSLPRLDEVTMDWRSITFCLAGAITFGAVFGVLPLGSFGIDIAALRDGGRGLTSSRSRELARRGLVLAQVALAIVLLSGAALMARSFAKLSAVHPGFDPTGVQSLTLSLPPSRYKTHREVEAFWRELVARIEALPGVVRAGGTNNLPLASGFPCASVTTDVSGPDGPEGSCMPVVAVTPGFFETMGMKVRGTTPTWSAVEAGTAPVIVSDAFAKRFWGSENPVGHAVKPFSKQLPDFPVVGVVGDMRGKGLQAPPVEAIYIPLVPPAGVRDWETSHQMYLVVRAPNVAAVTLVTAVHQVVGQMDMQVPIADVQSMELVVARSMAQTSFTMLLLLISATIALALSAVGMYGVISYLVSQRRTEIGIRMALGAQATDVSRLVVGDLLLLAGAGVLIGILAAIGSTRLLGSLLFGISPTDPLTLGGTGVAVLIVALLASLGPTRRAATIDPVEAMRT